MTQREGPGTNHVQLAKTLGRDPAGVTCSGGQMQSFRKGWAVTILDNTAKAHFYVRTGAMGAARSYCGLVAMVPALYGPGNYPKCSKCERMAKRKGENDG